MSTDQLETLPTEAVKNRTDDLHELVEDTLGERFFQEENLDRDQFIELLKCFYRVYSPLENRMIPILQSKFPVHPYDPRAIRLRLDFMALGVDDETIDGWQLTPTEDLIDFEDLPELLGCLYVVEGSEMGNHVMRSQLDEILPEDCLNADHFFRERGDETRERWSNFKDRLDERITTEEDLDRMVNAARKTFELFRRSFERRPI
jgi:heme oxygenase